MATYSENRAAIRELALNSLFFFCRGILGFDYMVPHVHGRLAQFLQHQPSNRKQITLPRGFLKTTVSTIGFPLWSVLPPRFPNDPWHDPNYRFLIEQNTIDNAKKRINAIRTIIQGNTLLQTLFPEIIPENFNKIRWSDEAAQIRRDQVHPEATFEAAGVGTALTSRHYTHIIEDDIVAAKKDDLTGLEAVPTREEVEKAIGLHRLNSTLLVNQTGLILNIGTRWANYDVIQYIIDNQMPPYVRFVMAIVDRNGKPTYPERFPDLESIRREVGNYIYSSQYLNNPISEEEQVFRPEWIQDFHREPSREEIFIEIAVDPAISEDRKADFSVVLAAGITADRKVYVLDYTRKRIDPLKLIEEIFSMYQRYPTARRIYIETVSYQKALKHFLLREAQDRNSPIAALIHEFNPGNRKDAKNLLIKGIQPIAARGDLFIRPWHRELRQELLDFPFAIHDDVSNALAMIVKGISYPSKKFVPEDPEKELHELVKKLRARNRTGLPFKDQVDWDGLGSLYDLVGVS